MGLKIHCKACLVVRQESDGMRRYCHLATGNYNARTGGVYGDLGLFTSRESFGEDLTELFNLLTGYTRPPTFHHLLLAPDHLRDGLVRRIRRQTDHARAGRPTRIVAKMNGLVDGPLIEELYDASEAGVTIDLIVRDICRGDVVARHLAGSVAQIRHRGVGPSADLRPGVPGLSSGIRAISIVDRYLEHARISYFENGGQAEYWLPSRCPATSIGRRDRLPGARPGSSGAHPRDPRDAARRYAKSAPHPGRRKLRPHADGGRAGATLATAPL